MPQTKSILDNKSMVECITFQPGLLTDVVAYLDDKPVGFVASLFDWDGFIATVKDLDKRKFPNLYRLVKTGQCSTDAQFELSRLQLPIALVLISLLNQNTSTDGILQVTLESGE